MPRVIVERSFDQPLTEAAAGAMMSRQMPCFATYNVTWVRTSLSTDRMRTVCEYDAADAESVRSVQRAADAPFDRVWTAEVFEAG